MKKPNKAAGAAILPGLMLGLAACEGDADYAWTVCYGRGYIDDENKSIAALVRCVRRAD